MTPDISIVIASWRSEETLPFVLASLSRQVTPATFEVVIADSSPQAPTVAACGLDLRLVHAASRLYGGQAMNLGVSVARSNLLAFLDQDCEADETWLDAHYNCLKSGHQVVTGPVRAARPCNAVALAENLVHMTDHCGRRHSGWARHALGCNCAMSRVAFDRVGGFPATPSAYDIVFSELVRAQGMRIWFDARARLSHLHRTRFADFVFRQFFTGAWLNRVRRRYHLQSEWLARCIVPQVLFMPYRTVKVTRSALQNRTLGAGLALPLALAGLLARTLGEMMPATALALAKAAMYYPPEDVLYDGPGR